MSWGEKNNLGTFAGPQRAIVRQEVNIHESAATDGSNFSYVRCLETVNHALQTIVSHSLQVTKLDRRRKLWCVIYSIITSSGYSCVHRHAHALLSQSVIQLL